MIIAYGIEMKNKKFRKQTVYQIYIYELKGISKGNQ